MRAACSPALQRPEPAEDRARRESAGDAIHALKGPALPRPVEPDGLRCGTEHEGHRRDGRDDSEHIEERRAVFEARNAGDVRRESRDDDEEHARADAFSQGTGKITGREKEALKHINKRVAELKAQGVPVEEAFKKAYDEARNNPQRDWRRGES